MNKINQFILTADMNQNSQIRGHMYPKVITQEYKNEITNDLDQLAQRHAQGYVSELRRAAAKSQLDVDQMMNTGKRAFE